MAKCKAPPVIEADETDALCTMSSATPPPANHHGLDPQATDPRQDSLIEYPCRFPIKVMGVKADGLVHAVTTLARRFDPGFDAATIELRDSRAGHYLGITITITATSRAQLDGLYRALSSHPMVKIVL
ncbi:protein of unknown function DUF493 [Verminephrobacter eiseniae EF01-2]|uniref:UPF0250 protein Veis_0472 n=2 Tax=Verminephrobacter eiseniae TaxID=364317 RepID=A1WF50_VEREI|nr:protein of unknown function DUF493 [Verminephrobacter eiseniae EF01-2]